MPSDIQNICVIDCQPPISMEMEKAGYTVLRLTAAPEPFFDLGAALEEHDFTPDLVLHTERLGKRTLITGLDEVDCPLLFWCVDPHLNAQWHSAYARLFDTTCCTQRGWITDVKQRGASDVRWLPWFGRDVPWTDWDKRDHGLAFVGRVTDQRPARKWMVEFLREKTASFNPAITQDLSFQDMFALYRNSRIIPNESIFGEVNFRLFEAASCGCLVLSQDLGDEQAELLEPGREFDTYSYITDFDEKLSLYLKNDRLAQTMGRAAYERIHADHMAVNRMQTIIEFAKNSNRNRVTGINADKWTTLTACAMLEAGVFETSPAELLRRLSLLPQDAEVTTVTLRIQALTGQNALLEDNLKTILGGDLYPDSTDLNLAGSMAALRVGHWDGAKAFRYRQLKATGVEESPPADRRELLTFWAKDLKGRKRLVQAGFPFDAARHLPAAAAECLMTILADEPEDLPTLRLLDTVLSPITGLEQARVGFLSILTLHERDDWRLALEIALANLKTYRLESGLEELHLARELALRQGQESAFDRVLKGRDASGLLIGRLGL